MPAAVDGQIPPRRRKPAGRGPDHHMRGTDRDHLLAPRASVGLARGLARHASDQKLTVPGGVRFLAAERRPDLGTFGPA
jgi:hypothetical protein